MAEDRLTGSDKRALVLWVLLGIVGAVFAHKYFFRAFPEASVDFKVSRDGGPGTSADICSEAWEKTSAATSRRLFSMWTTTRRRIWSARWGYSRPTG